MRVFLLIPVAVGLLLTGCGKTSSSTNPSATNNAATNDSVLAAPVDYIGAVGNAQKFAEKQIDLSYLHEAIEQFNAANGRYPKDLQELVPNWIGKVPKAPYGSKIVYDPDAGTVKVVQQ
ncbi:MAG: hypothetical protein WBN22_03130 [Verrucomicrobiia bacterium]